MQQRLDYRKASPAAVQAMLQLQATVQKSGLEPSLIELIKIRASQINKCAFFLHMHTKDARKAGETEERFYLLDAWRESSLCTPRERAALAWTDTLRSCGDGRERGGNRSGARALQRCRVVDLTAGRGGHQRLEPHRHRLQSAAPAPAKT